MKSGGNTVFLQEMIRVLQATREFANQLQKARDDFDYAAALKSIGNKAIGVKYFHDQSLNLIKWIYVHSTFSTVLKLYKEAIHSTSLGYHSSNLTSSFLFLQRTAFELLGLLNDSLDKQEREYTSAGLRRCVRNDLIEHQLGIDLLKTIVWARSEQFYIDMFEQGFSDRSANS